MTEAHVMTRGNLTRLRHLNLSFCHLKSCNKEFAVGDSVTKVGKHFFHSSCAESVYVDCDEDESEVESEGW